MQNTRSYEAIKMQAFKREGVSDVLMIEVPLSISINGNAFSVTMQTPGDETDLVRGILFTEGVYKGKTDNPEIHVTSKTDDGFISQVDVLLDESAMDMSQLNKRSLLSVASCGICGKTEIEFPFGKLEPGTQEVSLEDILYMFSGMKKLQTAFNVSGGCHAAAVFDGEKHCLVIREDIGRHNAVDKVIGALLSDGALSKGKFLMVSGRVSYEIITKCFMAGIPFLCAVSAPSSLAVDFAKELGITLIAFCREDRATVYSHPERLMAK